MRAERRARWVAKKATIGALVAWLLLLIGVHAFDVGLSGEHRRIEAALSRGALGLSGLALVAELSLIRDRGRASWMRFVVALLPLALVVERWWAPSEDGVVAAMVVVAAAFVFGFGSSSARLRLGSLMLGGVVAIGLLQDLHISFFWHGRYPLSGALADHFARSHWLQRLPLAASVIGFATALGHRRHRWPAATGLLLSLGAGALELMGTAAARQVAAAAQSDGVFPATWSVDELALTATLVEVALIAALVFLALAHLLRITQRRARFGSRGTVPALVLAACVTFAAQSPFRAPLPSSPPVPIAEAEPWGGRNYRWERRHPMGTQVVVLEGDGRAVSFYGREPVQGLRFAPLAVTDVFPDARAPAAALEQTLRRLLSQVGEVRVAVQRSDARHVPVPGGAARARYPFAATMVPRTYFQRTYRPDVELEPYEEDVAPAACPAAEPGELVGAYLARRSPNCFMEPAGTDVTIAAPLAPIGDVPRWHRREPRRPFPLLIGALLGLAAALLFAQRSVARDLAPLRGRREPVDRPHGRAPVRPSWLWRREATHWWGASAGPYRGEPGFLGPANRAAASLALRRRAWRILGRVLWRVLLGCSALVVGGLLGVLGSMWI